MDKITIAAITALKITLVSALEAGRNLDDKNEEADEQKMYDFVDQKNMAKYIIIAWIVLFVALTSLVCHYYTGCLTCDCFNEHIPTYMEIEY